MQVTLAKTPGNVYWFTNDGSIHLSLQKPKVQVDEPGLLSDQIMRQLIVGHDRKKIEVTHYSYLKQCLREKGEAIPVTLSDIDRRKPAGEKPQTVTPNAPSANGDSDRASELAELSVSKLKSALMQEESVKTIGLAISIEKAKEWPRKTALEALQLRMAELGVSTAATVSVAGQDMEITDTVEGAIAITKQ